MLGSSHTHEATKKIIKETMMVKKTPNTQAVQAVLGYVQTMNKMIRRAIDVHHVPQSTEMFLDKTEIAADADELMELIYSEEIGFSPVVQRAVAALDNEGMLDETVEAFEELVVELKNEEDDPEMITAGLIVLAEVGVASGILSVAGRVQPPAHFESSINLRLVISNLENASPVRKKRARFRTLDANVLEDQDIDPTVAEEQAELTEIFR
jgi:hypothetical protein